jgi:hypothetical protein
MASNKIGQLPGQYPTFPGAMPTNIPIDFPYMYQMNQHYNFLNFQGSLNDQIAVQSELNRVPSNSTFHLPGSSSFYGTAGS